MAALNLVPNEVVGYRIRAEPLNWTVVLVKKKGALSRHAGAEYEEPVGYYKSLTAAVAALVNHEAQRAGAELQQQALRERGTVADARQLMQAFAQAETAALAAVEQLRAQLAAEGLDETLARRRLAQGARLEEEPAV